MNVLNVDIDGEAIHKIMINNKKMPNLIPYVAKKISEIKPEDLKVSISGIIVNKEDNLFILDDGDNQIKVTFDNEINFKENNYVRVFADVLYIDDNLELKLELIQDLSKIDKLLYKKVQEFIKK